MATKISFYLHIFLAATIFAVALGKARSVYALHNFTSPESTMILANNVPYTLINQHDSVANNSTGNERQGAFDRNPPPHHLVAGSYASTLAQVTTNLCQSMLKARLTFSNNVSNLFRVPTLLSHAMASTKHQRWSSDLCFVRINNVAAYITQVFTAASPLVLLLSIVWLYFSGSFFFDVAHYTLHRCSKAKSRILRNIGYLHEVHHLYFNRGLKFNNRYRWQNMCFELPLELSCQLFGTWLGYLLASFANLTGPALLSEELLNLVLVFEVVRSFVVAFMEGHDSNHKSYSPVVPKDPHSFLVGPEYHALHHVDPSGYIGSTFKIFDWMLGTSCSLRSRRVTVVGSTDAFKAALKQELLSESVSCIEELQIGSKQTEGSCDVLVEVLARTDILILGPGSSCDSADELIMLFKKHHKAKAGHALLLQEVWYLDTAPKTCARIGRQTTESYSEARQTRARFARKLRDDKDILFRHIVCHLNAEWLKLKPELAAKTTLWWIRRGARTIPATFDFLAFFNYIHFMYYGAKTR
ncbi:hypothetical protein EG329_004862 [Mollisiaceae sp. DMI_Dod_QoI]|nr:hypothetical protein EG329_004862 [Helotiales sp. DMI_Dod_QoI]